MEHGHEAEEPYKQSELGRNCSFETEHRVMCRLAQEKRETMPAQATAAVAQLSLVPPLRAK
ncbi:MULTISPECIES: hypothetical protein [unclassified Mesorhizobium]|uniref:hypothetical protein n=1 Tax=unclassified Mesorhizobium TaxID=325217 RepID=UPI00333DCB8F